MLKNTKSRRASLRLETLEERTVLSAASATLPVLHSYEGASKTLYLNFLGNDVTTDWKTAKGDVTGVVTHTFDIDGDPNQFSGTEQDMIRHIWEIVAEDFAPFDIDVTTVYAGTFENGKALQVAIGDTNRDEFLATGISKLNGFVDDAGIPVLALPTNIQRQMAIRAAQAALNSDAFPEEEIIAQYMDQVGWETMVGIGNTVSHEAGHAFGMQHDRAANGGEYDNGTDTWTPIMGSNLPTDRHTWSKHAWDSRVTETGNEPIYDDALQILTEVLGLRADDHGDSNELATPMTEVNPGFSFVQSGIIGTMEDKDVFSFRVELAATYRIRVDVASFGNLDSRFTLSTAAGIVGVVNDHSGDRVLDEESGLRQIGDGVLDEEFGFRLEPGTEYFLQVDSNGIYGDLGKYEVSVTWVVREIEPLPEMPTFPEIPDPEQYYPGPDIWINPEMVYHPELVEPVYDGLVDDIQPSWELYVVDPVQDIWSNPELEYLPQLVESLDDGVVDYLPEVVESLDESLVDYQPYQEVWSDVAEVAPAATWQATSPVVYNSVSDAVFTQVNYSAFRSVSRYGFWF
jgi:hypothetical protein